MRAALPLLATAVLTLSACGGAEDDDPTIAVPSTGAQQSSAPPAAGASSAPVAAGATLLALVGTKDEPEAFEISLTTEDGTKVERLPAGKYTIKVTDQSEIHNFKLTGDSGVDMETGVDEKENPTWTVDLKPGDYTYVCTPHPSMSGSFVVT